jgi:hypothetical protein
MADRFVKKMLTRSPPAEPGIAGFWAGSIGFGFGACDFVAFRSQNTCSIYVCFYFACDLGLLKFSQLPIPYLGWWGVQVER